MPPPQKPARFGWCQTGHHEACPGEIKSSLNGKIMVCPCPHHEEVRKELEELL